MKTIKKTQKLKEYWSVLFLEEIQENVWMVSLIVNKSKRAINDWFNNRKNKRWRKIESDKTPRSLSCLRVCVSWLREFISTNPDAVLITYHALPKNKTLSRYVTRLGFVQTPMDGMTYWVRVAQKKREGPLGS